MEPAERHDLIYFWTRYAEQKKVATGCGVVGAHGGGGTEAIRGNERDKVGLN